MLEAEYALDSLGYVGVAIETNSHGIYLGDTMNEPLGLARRLAARWSSFIGSRRRVGSESRRAGRVRCSS